MPQCKIYTWSKYHKAVHQDILSMPLFLKVDAVRTSLQPTSILTTYKAEKEGKKKAKHSPPNAG